MMDFEHKDYFDSRCYFRGDEDKVVAILDSYAQNQINLTDINRVFELYHTKLFFDKVTNIPSWSEEKYQEYKTRTLKLKDVVYERFKQITEDNVVDIFNDCYVSYWDDFRKFFYMFKTYRCISKEKICEILKELHWNTFHILEDKDFVEFFDMEITHILEHISYGVDFVISYYLEEHKHKQCVYIPKNFSVEKRVKLIEDYLKGKDLNPNILQLIINAKHTKELPITPKMKKCADERNKEFWANNKLAFFYKYSFHISFGSFEDIKHVCVKNNEWIFEYDIDWIKDNTDYPTLLNNFIYLFEYTDMQARCTFISNNIGRSIFEDIFTVRGNGMYKKSTAFNMLDSLSDIQMRGYVNQLVKLNIYIEDVIKWFFESYLLQEFGIKNYICNMPDSGDSMLSKCKALASAIDGILSKYKMLCDDGAIDQELFKYITDSPRIKDIPSRIRNKYCYIKSKELYKEINMLFSSQSMLGYTERTKSKYNTFIKLISNESIKLSECETYNLESLNWLLQRGTIYIKDGIIKYDWERVFILSEFYEKDVISLQHIKSPLLKQLIKNGDISTDYKLLSKPEYQYFDYLLNNSEFSDGKAIRNRYIHDSIVPDNNTMNADYITLLKVMILLIIKINDDCCIYDEIKKEGDFYEL